MKRALSTWLLGLCLTLVAGSVAAVLPQDWRVVGQGELRWFGFPLYAASLWAPANHPQAEAPYALELRYARDIPATRLVEASIEEMQRLGAPDANLLARWKRELERVFPDVRSGEVLIGLHLPGRGAAFYHQGRLIGLVEDAAFARNFFAIWLDPRTRAPALRASLLGHS